MNLNCKEYQHHHQIKVSIVDFYIIILVIKGFIQFFQFRYLNFIFKFFKIHHYFQLYQNLIFKQNCLNHLKIFVFQLLFITFFIQNLLYILINFIFIFQDFYFFLYLSM